MNMTIFIMMLFTLQLFCWIIGNRASKNLCNQENYFLAGKEVKLFPLMMTFIATQIGGGVILGASDEAYKFGWPVLFYPLGTSIGMIFLGLGIGRKLAEFQVTTIAEIFEVFYKSTTLRKFASLLSVFSLFMILVGQIIGSSKFLVSLGFTNTPLFILFWGIVIVYTANGGLKAVISTDTLQAAFFIFVFLLCFGYVLYYKQTMAQLEIPQIDDIAHVSSKLCGWLILPLIFMIIGQDMGQRCFAAVTPKIVSGASLLAGIFSLVICIIPVFLGCVAKNLGLIIPKESSVLMTTITFLTNPWMTALVGCAIIAAIVSTATSLINAIGSNIANDFKFCFSKKIDSVFIGKGITCMISGAAIVCAFYFDNIVDVLMQSYELYACCLFIPIIFALLKKEGNTLSGFSSILCGAGGFVLFRFIPIEFPREIASILLSLIGYLFGEIFAMFQVRSNEIVKGGCRED